MTGLKDPQPYPGTLLPATRKGTSVIYICAWLVHCIDARTRIRLLLQFVSHPLNPLNSIPPLSVSLFPLCDTLRLSRQSANKLPTSESTANPSLRFQVAVTRPTSTSSPIFSMPHPGQSSLSLQQNSRPAAVSDKPTEPDRSLRPKIEPAWRPPRGAPTLSCEMYLTRAERS